MLSRFSIRNFKSFRSLDVSGLSNINIIVGHSASGKTSILEALRIGLSGQPQTMWSLLAQRGSLMFFPPGATKEQSESFWAQYFHNFDIKQPISFELTDRDGSNGLVVIYLDAEGSASSVQELPGLPPVIAQKTILTVDRRTYSGDTSALRMHTNQQGVIQFDQGPEIDSASEFFPATQLPNSQQVANWFSSLSVSHSDRPIINTIRSNFPRILDLSVQAPNGIYALHATVDDLPRKIPVTSVSAGITKFISTVLAIEKFAGGYVMLDEIENGIYYELFEPFWRAIVETAIRTDTQMFITTHSLECLRGLNSLLEEVPELFSLLQVVQNAGLSRLNVVPGRDASAALETGIEVRS